MKPSSDTFEQIDRRLVSTMQKLGIPALRISLGIIFVWFGVLKFFPGLSAAEEIATRTIQALTFGALAPALIPKLLALLECAIGLGLIFHKYLRITLGLLFLQMIGTFMPLLLFPTETFVQFPLVPNLEGQYIIKNLILVSAGIVIGSTVRGGAPKPAVVAK